MSGLSTIFKIGECREVVFWLLLLGSWQFLASPGSKTGIIGAVGAAAFLVYAWANLDRLRGLGLDHARWRSAARANWVLAAVSGVLAGIIVFVIGTVSGQNMRLGDNWKLIALQVTLGPVLEEIVFRGYLFAFLMWLLSKAANDAGRNRLVVVFAAVVFAAGSSRAARRQLATIGVHHVHGNALRLDQVALWIDGSRGRFTRGIQPGPLCDQRCRVAR